MDEETDRLVLNVGGVSFETYISTLQNIPDTRLAWLTEGLDPDSKSRKEFFFDRHPGVFVHILNYYRTGKLHTPTDICGPLFEEELNFWGIDEKQMEPCCWESFTKHREAELNLKSFEGPGFEDLKSIGKRSFSSFNTNGRISCRERMDRLWHIIDQPHSCALSKYLSIWSCFMIVLSVTVYCLNTMPQLQKHKEWRDARYGIDFFCMCWFTLEFTIRFLVCPDRKVFVQSVMNWVDFLSVIPSYLSLFFINDKWLINLVIIRLLRVFRFFKLSYGLQVLLHTLKASSYELTLLLLILLIPVVIFSSLVHTLETNLNNGEKKFVSIPETFWWCLITMTSVGYGDMVPETWAGKMVGGLCAICGVLIVALPISVIGSNFSLYYAHVRARLKLPSKDRKILAGNLRGLLKQPLSLSSRERDRRSLKKSHVPAVRKKGAPRRQNDKKATNVLLETDFSSSEEVEMKTPSKELVSSEVCLDWDSTMESNINFRVGRAVERKTRKGIGRQDGSTLCNGSESEGDDSNQSAYRPVARGRRGGTTTLDVEVEQNSPENMNPAPRGRRGGTICLEPDNQLDPSSSDTESTALESQGLLPRGRRGGTISPTLMRNQKRLSDENCLGSKRGNNLKRRGATLSLQKEETQETSDKSGEDCAEDSDEQQEKENAENPEEFFCGKKRTASRSSFDFLASGCNSRRGSSAQDTPSSRRNSMKMLELSVMPEKKCPPSTIHPSVDNESNSSPTAKNAEDKKKLFRSRKLEKEVNDKWTDKVKLFKNHTPQSYPGARRKGILSTCHDEEIMNGLNSISSDEGANSCSQEGIDNQSPVLSPELHPAVNCYDRTKSHPSSDNSISSLNLLNEKHFSVDEHTRSTPKLNRMPGNFMDTFDTNKNTPYVYTPLAYDNPAEILQQKLARKYSRSEYNLRTNCSSLFVGNNLRCPEKPMLRQVSSDIELGYIESGV